MEIELSCVSLYESVCLIKLCMICAYWKMIVLNCWCFQEIVTFKLDILKNTIRTGQFRISNDLKVYAHLKLDI